MAVGFGDHLVQARSLIDELIALKASNLLDGGQRDALCAAAPCQRLLAFDVFSVAPQSMLTATMVKRGPGHEQKGQSPQAAHGESSTVNTNAQAV